MRRISCCRMSPSAIFMRSGKRSMRPDWLRPISISSATSSLRSEEHTSELQSLMRISYAVFCLKKKKKTETEEDRIHEDEYSTSSKQQERNYSRNTDSHEDKIQENV